MSAKPADWTAELPALVACGVLPKLPPLGDLRAATDSASHIHDTAGGYSATASGSLLFPSQRLYDAVRRCMEAQSSISPAARSAATLIVASVSMEDYVRSHSTRAKLVAAQQARNTRAAAQQAADAHSASSADVDAELLAFLRSAGAEQITERLLAVLDEPEQTRALLHKIVRSHDPATLAAILGATRRAHATGGIDRADGGGKRTLGGIFILEAKRHKAGAQRAVEQQRLPQLPPLRPYQRDVAGMALASWGMAPTSEILGDGGGGAAAAELQARFRSLADNWRGNWLVSAPTNSGKTRMFVEVARGVVASKPPGLGAVLLVLVPNVILTSQHAACFDSAQLPRTLTSNHSGEKPLAAGAWQEAVRAATSSRAGGRSTVVVCTVQSFLNLLLQGAATLDQVDLLVLDEAHHCKDDHPYAKVISFYNPATATTAGATPRILAVTASPVSEKDQNTLALRMTELLGRLGAQLHLVNGEDPEVAAVVPEPRQVECPVAMRPVDRQLMLALQSFALNAALELGESLAAVQAQGGKAREEKELLEQSLDTAVTASVPITAACQQLVTRLDPLGQWLAKGREFAAKYGCPSLDLVCRLMDVIRKAVELVEDAGFEGALPFLARKAAALCRDEVAAVGGSYGAAGGGSGSSTLPPCPPPTALRDMMFSAAAAAAAASGAVGASCSCPAAAAPEPQLLTALRAAAATLPSAHDVAARVDAIKAAEKGPASGNSCTDIPLRVSKLVRELLVEGGDVQFLSSPEAADLVRDCFASGELKEELTFPKFWALLRYLQGYRDRDLFHGIIFVRTRQAVFHVADMIRRTQQLQFIEVLELIGHNTTTKRSTLAPEHDRHGRGMNDSQQQQLVRMFKEPGRKVLIATSAAEEGLDVPSCEFVVRYNAAATGIQLLQSRGRARRKVAEFFAILQDGTLDTYLHAKSRLEESNMHDYNQTYAATRGSAGR